MFERRCLRHPSITRQSGNSRRRLRSSDREVPESRSELVSISTQLFDGQRSEHDRQRRYRERAQEPGEDTGIDARVLAKCELEIELGSMAGSFQEHHVDEISRLGSREQAGELRCTEIGERFDRDPVDHPRWRKIGERFVNDIDVERASVERELGSHVAARVTHQTYPRVGLGRRGVERTYQLTHLVLT